MVPGRRSAAPGLALLLAVVVAGLGGCAATRPSLPAPAEYSASYRERAVACDHGVASRAGDEMLALGGNAVDAAVAASFCLSVVRPFSCGIGGGGFMIISLPPDADHPARRSIAIDYRESCPAGVGPDHYADLPPDASQLGAHAVAVPGAVAGLLYALEKYGTLDRATVLAPAIRAAREGYVADAFHVNATKKMRTVHDEHPELRLGLADAWVRLAREGRIAVGDLIVNEPHARALELIARDGADAFYHGPIGAALVEAVARDGGALTTADLAGFEVRERAPLESEWGDLQVLAMPPPSSGGVAMQQVIGILDRLGALAPGSDIDTVAWRHMLLEAFKHAFADRARWLADDTFYDVPVAHLTSPEYIAELAARVRPDSVLAAEAYGTIPPMPPDAGTSHVSVLDSGGMAVGLTETINLYYGACLEVPGFGFLLNDEMDDFTTSVEPNAFGLVQSARNTPAPGKRPLSSMCPTILLRDGEPVAIAGASGGPRIITGTLQVLLAAVVAGDDAGQAVARPRLHHQWSPNEVRVGGLWSDEAVLDGLRALGHVVTPLGDKPAGVVQAIVVRDGVISAASDPRKGGRPAGR
ncbi:gamma-glutamyltransferase [bacterium]|nr:gamma-glutamyltransferase [bacterium]